MRLEETDHLAGKARIAAEDPSPRLRDHTPEQIDGRRELRRGLALARRCPHAFGLAQDGAGDPHQLLVEPFHACLALRAHRRADPGARLATALRDLEDPPANGTGALPDLFAQPTQRTREHADPVGQQRGVRRVVNVGFDDGRIDPEAPPRNDSPLPTPRHQLRQQILEDRRVKQLGQTDQRLGVRDALAVDSAEGPIDQAPAHLPLALIEAPVVQVLEDQHPQHDGGGGPQAAAALTLGMALGQRLRNAIDERLVVEQHVDPAKRGIPELVGIGQEYFHEAALPVRSPHHGASGEAARPQGCTA